MKIRSKVFIRILLTSLCFLSTQAFSVQLTLKQYQDLTKKNTGRCNQGIKTPECHEEINYAVSKGMIDAATGKWAKANGYFPTFRQRGNKIAGVCQCGCFSSNTKLLTATGWVPVHELKRGDSVTSFNTKSKLQMPEFEEKTLKSAVNGPEIPPLFLFETNLGQKISVTQHHGMVLASGRMKAAKDVRVGESFVTVDGENAEIIKISRLKTKDPVYNVEVDSAEKIDHIIAADGLLVGDLVWQNTMQKEMNSIQLRK